MMMMTIPPEYGLLRHMTAKITKDDFNIILKTGFESVLYFLPDSAVSSVGAYISKFALQTRNC